MKIAKTFDTRLAKNYYAETTPIYYVNAIPGAGKTYQFIELAYTHVTNKVRSVLVYAAPSIKLINQVVADLVARGVPAHKIKKVVSGNEKGGRVADRFRDALVGSVSRDVERVPDGTILVTTHECLARAAPDMPGKDRVCLVYDEARACLQSNYSVQLPPNMYEYLRSTQTHINKDGQEIRTRLINQELVVELPGEKKEEMYVWTWNNYKLPVPDKKTIESMLPRNKQTERRAERIHNFIEFVHSSSIDVYVMVKEPTKSKPQYTINNIFSPARMFYGYGKVLILSAFFETSEMYHFLARSVVQRTSDVSLTLQDITLSFVDKKRLLKILVDRLSNTEITYILDLNGRTLTKSEMFEGIVVDGELSEDQKKDLAIEWQKLGGKKRAPSYRKIARLQDKDEDDYGVENFGTRDMSSYSKLLATHLENYHPSVIRYMTERAIDLQQAWLKHMKMPQEELLVGVNATYKTQDTDIGNVWEAEGLDYLNKRIKRWKVDKKTRNIIKKVSMVCHGDNSMRNHHTIAFLASMKYNREQKKFLRYLAADYDSSTARTIDYALQVLFRCNVRVAQSDAKCLLIVTDKELAHKLSSHFRELACKLTGKKCSSVLRVIPPTGIIDYRFPTLLRYDTPYNSENHSKSRVKYETSAKGRVLAELKKIYLQSSDGKKYHTLTVQISRARKDKDEELVAQLIKKRKKLMTLSQWKKTSEGATAFQKLTAPKKSNEQKLLSVLNNPDFWPAERSKRLPLILAAHAAGIKRKDITAYPGDGLKKNWPKEIKWEKGDPVAFILGKAKKAGVAF